MATPHNEMQKWVISLTSMLMPGDPLRAKHIAETFLKTCAEVNNVRGMLNFTGTYKGRKDLPSWATVWVSRPLHLHQRADHRFRREEDYSRGLPAVRYVLM